MISRIDHVSLAVKDYEKALDFFQNVLGVVPGKGGPDESLKFFWRQTSMGDLSRLELICPTGEGSFLDGFLKDKKDGGVHHITLETPDIREAKKKLEENNIPYFGYNEIRDDWKELFIHPKHAFGVLIQIAEFNPDDELDDSVKFPRGQKWSAGKKDNGCTVDFAHPGGGKVRVDLTREEIERLIRDLKETI
ncbi:MAG: VOC family protein [Deltaproteobacteria bacterium]|nr:VOC family protein [Deltaproteobacteria bacterium]